MINWHKLEGKFLVIDGPDGAGKSTQVDLLKQKLETHGVPVERVRDPGGTNIGEQIRTILLDPANTEMEVRCEAFLYMASRAQLYGEKIKPALASGQCVLCDRWLSSTLAYQAAAGNIGTSTVLAMAQAGLERVWPDFTVLIDLPSDEGLKRVGPTRDRMEQKSDQFHREVRQAFLSLTDCLEKNTFAVVDGADSPTTVEKAIEQVLTEQFR